MTAELLSLLNTVEIKMRPQVIFKRKHFFYDIAEKIFMRPDPPAVSLLYFFNTCQKALRFAASKKYELAREYINDLSLQREKLQDESRVVADMMFFPASAYLDYIEKEYASARPKIDLSLVYIEKYYCKDPEMNLLMKAEQTLNIYRILIEQQNIEEAIIYAKVLLNAIIHFQCTPDLLEVDGIETLNAEIKGYEEWRDNCLDFIFRKWFQLTAEVRETLVKEVLLFVHDHKAPLAINKMIHDCFEVIKSYYHQPDSFIDQIKSFFSSYQIVPPSLVLLMIDYLVLFIQKNEFVQRVDIMKQVIAFLERNKLYNRALIIKRINHLIEESEVYTTA
jgi:hypothetical protein